MTTIGAGPLCFSLSRTRQQKAADAWSAPFFMTTEVRFTSRTAKLPVIGSILKMWCCPFAFRFTLDLVHVTWAGNVVGRMSAIVAVVESVLLMLGAPASVTVTLTV